MNFIQFLNSLSITTKVTEKRIQSINSMKSTQQAFAKYLNSKNLTKEDYKHVFKYLSDHDMLEKSVHNVTFNTLLTTHKYFEGPTSKDKLFDHSSDEESYQKKTFPNMKKKSKHNTNQEESPSSSSKHDKRKSNFPSSAEEVLGSFSEYFKKFKNVFDFTKTSEESFFDEETKQGEDDDALFFRSRYRSWKRLFEADLSKVYPTMIINGNELPQNKTMLEIPVFESLYQYDPETLPNQRKKQFITKIDNHAKTFQVDYEQLSFDDLTKSLNGQLWRIRQLDLVKPVTQGEELNKIFMGEEITLSRICAIVRDITRRKHSIINGDIVYDYD